MHPTIIQAVGCRICGVKPGEPCIDSFEGQNGHGDRMDRFRCEASYQDRLQVYLDGLPAIMAWVEKLATSNPEMHKEVVADIEKESVTGNLWLTAKEVQALRANPQGGLEHTPLR